MCNSWLGLTGGILAILGVVAAPITSGDTAFRSARLIIAEAFHIEQRPIPKRLLVSLPLFGASLALLIWQVEDANGFNTIWQYAGWSNQALAVFMLWAITVYLVRQKKNYWITLIPALFMTCVCTTFLFISKLAFHLLESIAYIAGGVCLVIAAVWFCAWMINNNKTKKENETN